MFNEGKTAKYLKYAVGEVLLIMVGILLALQVNDWNEERKLEKERLGLIDRLKEDFQTNERLLEDIVSKHEAKIVEMEAFLKAAANEGERISVAEMKTLFRNFHRSIRFVPVLGYYRTAVSTGSIALLSDPTLNELFIKYLGHHERLELARAEYRSDVFSGKSVENRDQIGSLWQL